MSVLEMAKLYYPRLWDKSRLEALVDAGRLTEEEYRECLGEISLNQNDDPAAWSQPAAVTLAGAGETVDLEGMTVKQLKTCAQERGISLAGKTLKEDIVEAVKAAF